MRMCYIHQIRAADISAALLSLFSDIAVVCVHSALEMNYGLTASLTGIKRLLL